MGKSNKSSVSDRDRKAIAGIKQQYANVPAIVLDGVSYAPSDVVKSLQAQIDAADATASAETAFHQAVAAEKVAGAKANGLFRALRTRVFSDFKSRPDVLAVFGLSLPQRQVPNADKVAEAVKKRAATRAARHTMGKRQKADVKGTVPAAPPPAGKPA